MVSALGRESYPSIVACELVGCRGTSLTTNRPMSIGIAVPRARTSKKPEASPGNSVCASSENQKAESPKPDKTRPVVVARALDGKLFAVVFIAALSPALPPNPVIKLHATSNVR
jgi:hypothetical protein